MRWASVQEQVTGVECLSRHGEITPPLYHPERDAVDLCSDYCLTTNPLYHYLFVAWWQLQSLF